MHPQKAAGVESLSSGPDHPRIREQCSKDRIRSRGECPPGERFNHKKKPASGRIASLDRPYGGTPEARPPELEGRAKVQTKVDFPDFKPVFAM
jgi:hypothetical protein